MKSPFNIEANWKKFAAPLTIAAGLSLGASGCSDASMASRNLSKAADNFEIDRRIVFYNGITGEYMLSVEGRCSVDVSGQDKKLSVTCKTEDGEYLKHQLGLSDNVTYFSEQLQAAKVSVNHYRVVFKPQAIIPDVDVRGNLQEAITVQPN